MTKTINPWLNWIPRILSIIILIFFGLMSLDVFEPGLSIGQVLLALFMHNIPVFFMLIVLVVSWRREVIAGVVFLLLGVAYVFMLIFRSQIPWYLALSWSLTVAGPVILTGILFIIVWRKKKLIKQDEN